MATLARCPRPSRSPRPPRSALPEPRRPVQEPPGHAADRRARGGPRFARPRGHLAAGPHRSTSISSSCGRAKATSTSRPCSTSPAGTWSAGRSPRRLPGARLRRARRRRGARRAAAAAAARRRPVRRGRGRAATPSATPAAARRARCRCWPAPRPSDNPCATAPCRTADNTRKAACCRDLQVEIMCTRAQRRLEALVRSRRSPYLCKIERAGDYSLDVEMISACGYLEAGRGRLQPPRPPPARRPHRQARPLLRMAAQEPGPASRVRLRPAPASQPPGRGASVQGPGGWPSLRAIRPP